MKASTSLKKYLGKRIRSINSCLKELDARMTAENIHDLRVEIKKMKAVFALINSGAENFGRKKALKSLDKIFKQAGLVREMQLEVKALKNLKLSAVLGTYMLEQAKTLDKKKKRLRDFGEKQNRIRIKDELKMTIPYCKKVSSAEINKFIQKKKDKIQKLKLRKSINNKDLHKLRKKLKEMQYVTGMLSDADSKNGNEQLQKSLGKWHDKVIIGKQLRKAMQSANRPARDIKRLEVAHHKIEAETARLYRHIINSGAFVPP